MIFKKIKLDLTSICNLTCDFCPYHGINPEITEKKSLDKELIFKLFKDLSSLNYEPTIRFAGTGEALCHPNFKEILDYLNENDIKLRLITNGVLLNKHSKALSTSLERLIVSIHGNSQTHDSLTNHVGSFEKAISGIKNIKKNNPYLDIVMHMAITPKNYTQIESHSNLAKSLNVMPRYQHFRMTETNLSMGEIDHLILEKQFEKLISKGVKFSTIPKIPLNKLAKYYDSGVSFIKDPLNCSVFTDDIHVRYTGKVYICDNIEIGDLNNQNIFEIISSSDRQNHIKYIQNCISESNSLPEKLCNRCRFH